MTQRPPPVPGNYDDLREEFSDIFQLQVNPWSAVMTFGLRATNRTEANKFTLRMRMSLQAAKALAVLLLRNIRTYEEQTGADIDLPDELLKGLNIAPEDWHRFTGA